jgi:hypothetical protein
MQIVCSLSIDIEMCADQTYSKCGDRRVEDLIWSAIVCHGRSWCKVNVYLFPTVHGSYVPEIPAKVKFCTSHN